MKIAIAGLGRMGMQIAQKLAESEHTLWAGEFSDQRYVTLERFCVGPAHMAVLKEILPPIGGPDKARTGSAKADVAL